MLEFFFKKENRNFLRLFFAQLISQFGDRIHQMALIGLIAERAPGSAWGLAKLLSFTIIPVFIVGPIAGVYVDRWDRRRILFLCDILRGLLVLTIPFIFIYWESMIPIYVVVFLIFCFSRFYVPAKMSILPDLVPEKNLLMANSFMTTTGMIAFVMGCALGGFMVDWWGARGGFLWDAGTFFVSAALIISIPSYFRQLLKRERLIARGKEMLKIERSILAEVLDGVRYLIKQKEIRFVINTLFILLAAAGAVYVVIIIFIQESFHSITKHLGGLAVFLGLGLFLGSVLYGRFGRKWKWYNTIFGCLAVGGFLMVLFATLVHVYPNVYLAAALALTLGAVTGPIFIASNTIVHLVSTEEMRGKVFSALEIVIHFAFLVSMLISSLLHKVIDSFWILSGIGGLFCLIGLVGLARYKNGQGLAFSDRDKV